MPVYLVFVYLLHPWLGGLTFAGALVLTRATDRDRVDDRAAARVDPQGRHRRNAIANSNARNADVLKAMSFAGRAVERFNLANPEHLSLQTTPTTSPAGSVWFAVLRMILQFALLGLGAYP